VKFTCFERCINPTAGDFHPGDIVEDPTAIEILDRDGQLRCFRKAKEDPVLSAPAESQEAGMPPDEGLGEGMPPAEPVAPETAPVTPDPDPAQAEAPKAPKVKKA
jgi:hypothetical protein